MRNFKAISQILMRSGRSSDEGVYMTLTTLKQKFAEEEGHPPLNAAWQGLAGRERGRRERSPFRAEGNLVLPQQVYPNYEFSHFTIKSESAIIFSDLWAEQTLVVELPFESPDGIMDILCECL